MDPIDSVDPDGSYEFPCAACPAGWVYCMIGTVGVSLLEQQRNYKEAVSRLQLLLGVLLWAGLSWVGLKKSALAPQYQC